MYDKTGATDMVSAVYSALYALQHRGQESCGIALNVDGIAFGPPRLRAWWARCSPSACWRPCPDGAKMATGHMRYATAGSAAVQRAADGLRCKGVPWPYATTAAW